MIDQGSPELRVAAVTALSEIGSPGAMEALVRALEDEDTRHSHSSSTHARTRGHSIAVPRIEAAFALGRS